MNAKEVLDKHIDGEELLAYYDFSSVTRSGHLLRAKCKLHDSSNPTSFVYNTESNMWYCHARPDECGGGDAYELVKKLEKCSFPESVRKIAEIFNIDISQLKLITLKDNSRKEQEEWLKIVEKLDKANQLPDLFVPPEVIFKNISKFRNFSAECLKYFDAKFISRYPAISNDGKEYFLYNRLSIPIYFKNILIGLALRRTKSNDIQKWSLQGFEKRHVLYNFDNCVEYLRQNPEVDEVIVVEGCFDVWAYWEAGIYNVVATFGCSITKEQQELLGSICSTIILSYDGDTGGKMGIKKTIQKCKNFFDIYVVQFNDGEDPANIPDLIDRYKDKLYYTRWC